MAGAATLPAAAWGYDIWQDAAGDLPPRLSPYAPDDDLNQISTPPFQRAPLLILLGDSPVNPFGRYYSEILRAEGLNFFAVAMTTAIQLSDLQQFNGILLAEQPAAAEVSNLLRAYVERGGNLIAMRPDVRVAAWCGLRAVGATQNSTYLLIDAEHPIGHGFTAMALQFHGSADQYRLDGARAVAWLADRDNRRSDFPAVAVHTVGRGNVAVWAFDLARSVALMRQGNPALSGQEHDGLQNVRATDQFVGWFDRDRLAIPQADEQQRLLAKLVAAQQIDQGPLPRLWYFPDTVNSVLVPTSDAHQNPTSAVDEMITRVERYGGHLSIYYQPPLFSQRYRVLQRTRMWLSDIGVGGESYFPSPARVVNWRARGHEFTVHPDVENDLDGKWANYWEVFTGLGWGPISQSARTHLVLWTGWVETARVQATYGIRMNHDYYQFGPMFRAPGAKWLCGYFTGSGYPMRFVDQQGRVLDIYQQVTQLADDHLLKLHWQGIAELSAEEALAVARPFLRQSATDHSVITVQFHADPYAQPEPHFTQAARWLEGMLETAAASNMPIWCSAEWQRFLEARHGAALRTVRWDSAALRLSLIAQVALDPARPLGLLLPNRHAETQLCEVTLGGRSVPFQLREMRGMVYASVAVTAGTHSIVAQYS
jgi:hypothetical protein